MHPKPPDKFAPPSPVAVQPSADGRLKTTACATSTGIITNQAAIIALFRVVNRYVVNLPAVPAYPAYPAPVVRETEGGREMMMHRGMPTDAHCATHVPLNP